MSHRRKSHFHHVLVGVLLVPIVGVLLLERGCTSAVDMAANAFSAPTVTLRGVLPPIPKPSPPARTVPVKPWSMDI